MLGDLGVPRDADVYLCGPVSFMDGLSADLAAFGLDASRIHMETFGAGRP
jgi:ferredoxin-NADP reductase